MPDRNASAALFGYDFQARAAIVIMLDNIKEAKSIKLEGEEDIEVLLKDGNRILAQAKSTVRIDDFSKSREKLNSALISLSEGAAKVPATQLILITNSPNPFNDDNSRPLFWGPCKVRYHELPKSSQDLVQNYLKDIKESLDPEMFTVQRIPFHSDDEKERSKAIKESINEFLGTISVTTPGLAGKLYDVWTSQLFFNGTVREKAFHMSKESFIWPIIVIETDIENVDEELRDEFDEALYNDITRLYHEIIDTHCEHYEFITKVLSDYNSFQGNRKTKATDFAKSAWDKYVEEFDVPGIDADTQKNLTIVILYSIVRRWTTIERIRKGASL